jgi:hypothetical protein
MNTIYKLLTVPIEIKLGFRVQAIEILYYLLLAVLYKFDYSRIALCILITSTLISIFIKSLLQFTIVPEYLQFD